MPSFDFNPIVIKPKEHNHKTNYVSGKYEIIQKDLTGVVTITLDAEYYVKVYNKLYRIIPENHNCEGIENVYPQILDEHKHRVLVVRTELLKRTKLPKIYKPFAPGVYVKGNVIKNNITHEEMFHIKKVYIERSDIDAVTALKFFRNNYEKISNALRKLNE